MTSGLAPFAVSVSMSLCLRLFLLHRLAHSLELSCALSLSRSLSFSLSLFLSLSLSLSLLFSLFSHPSLAPSFSLPLSASTSLSVVVSAEDCKKLLHPKLPIATAQHRGVSTRGDGHHWRFDAPCNPDFRFSILNIDGCNTRNLQHIQTTELRQNLFEGWAQPPGSLSHNRNPTLRQIPHTRPLQTLDRCG